MNRIEQCYRELCREGRQIARMFSGNPGEHGITFPPELLQRHYVPAALNPSYHPDSQGVLAARESISAYYREDGYTVPAEQILLTSGTSESFRHLCALLAAPGDNLLVPTPGYPVYDEVARHAHVELRGYRLAEARGWRIDLTSVEAAIDERTRGIVVVSPHNPTGMVATMEELTTLAQLANRHALPLICDEVFSDAYFGNGRFPRALAVPTLQRCFTLNGISKLLALPSLKLAWIAVTGDPTWCREQVDQLSHIADAYLSVHLPIQQALPGLMQDSHDFRQAYRRTILERHQLAHALLGTIPVLTVTPSDGGISLMARVTHPRWADEDDLICTLLRNHDVFFHPGYYYDHHDGTYVVLSYLTAPDVLDKGVAALSELLG